MISTTMKLVIGALSIGGLAASPTLANIVLTIDITNPTAVVFAGTGAPSGVTVSGGGGGSVVLDTPLAAFGAAGNAFTGVPTLIASAGSGPAYTNVTTVGGTSLVILGMSGQFFNTGTSAFSGSSTADLSSLVFNPVGTTGNIFFRDNTGFLYPHIVVGQYQIIPTPGAAAVLGLGGLLAARRRR